MSVRFSPTNLARTAASITASSSDGQYPVANVKSANKPHQPWKSTALGDQWILIDHGSAKAVDVFALINGNVTSVRCQANATDSWGGALGYDQLVTVGQSPSDMYQHGHRAASPQFFRYNRIFIPSQATTDGASQYKVGALWLGAVTTPPQDLLVEPDEETPEPFHEERPGHGGWVERTAMGYKRFLLSAIRYARSEGDLAAWRAIEQAWPAAGYALVLLRDAYPAETFVMQRQPATWRHGRVYMESPLEAEELV